MKVKVIKSKTENTEKKTFMPIFNKTSMIVIGSVFGLGFVCGLLVGLTFYWIVPFIILFFLVIPLIRLVLK